MKYKFRLIGLSVVLFLVMFISSVHAGEVLNPYGEAAFNIGDSIHISGYISLDEGVEAARVIFYAENEILDETIELTQKYYTFSKDVPATFSQINKGTLIWTIPSEIGLSSDWKIKVKIIKNVATIKEISSNYFEITDEFRMILGTNADIFNLGQEIILGGTVLNAGRQPVDGQAEVFIEEENHGLVFSAKTSVINGYVEYAYRLKATDPAGKYSVIVEVNDGIGNSDSISITNITVSNALTIDSIPKKSELSPGESVIITGTVRNVRGKPVSDIEINGYLAISDDEKAIKYIETTDSNGKFAFNVNIPERAPPGKYTLEITAIDAYGNIGLDEHTLNIGRIKEAEIILKTNKSTIYKGEELNLTYILKNTGNVDLSGQIELYLDDKKIKSSAFSVNRSSEKSIEETWTLEEELTGTHELYALVIIDDEELISSENVSLEIHKRERPFELEITRKVRLVIFAIILMAMILYLKRKDIKDYLWHKEFKKKTEKKEKTISPE